MLKFLKSLFGSAEEVEVVDDNVVVQDAFSGEDALMKNALLAMQTGKVVVGTYEDGVLTSKVSQENVDD